MRAMTLNRIFGYGDSLSVIMNSHFMSIIYYYYYYYYHHHHYYYSLKYVILLIYYLRQKTKICSKRAYIPVSVFSITVRQRYMRADM